MDGPGMGEIPPAILDDIMRTSHVIHPTTGHFNGEYELLPSCHGYGINVGVGANETVPSSDQLKPQLVILEQPKSVSTLQWLIQHHMYYKTTHSYNCQ